MKVIDTLFKHLDGPESEKTCKDIVIGNEIVFNAMINGSLNSMGLGSSLVKKDFQKEILENNRSSDTNVDSAFLSIFSKVTCLGDLVMDTLTKYENLVENMAKDNCGACGLPCISKANACESCNVVNYCKEECRLKGYENGHVNHCAELAASASSVLSKASKIIQNESKITQRRNENEEEARISREPEMDGE